MGKLTATVPATIDGDETIEEEATEVETEVADEAIEGKGKKATVSKKATATPASRPKAVVEKAAAIPESKVAKTTVVPKQRVSKATVVPKAKGSKASALKKAVGRPKRPVSKSELVEESAIDADDEDDEDDTEVELSQKKGGEEDFLQQSVEVDTGKSISTLLRSLDSGFKEASPAAALNEDVGKESLAVNSPTPPAAAINPDVDAEDRRQAEVRGISIAEWRGWKVYNNYDHLLHPQSPN